MLPLPASMMDCASKRWIERLVGSAVPYSMLKLPKPLEPSGTPIFPATENVRPWPPIPLQECLMSPMLSPQVDGSPGLASRKPPVWISKLPPEGSFLSWKFMTPAIASDPYWAAAPSRSTSACRMAIEGMTEMSGPCEPSAMPLPSQVMTAARWRRLPLTKMSVWSGAKLRKFAGRTTVAASLMGWVLMLKDGMTVRNWPTRSRLPCRTRSLVLMTSTGTVDSITERGSPRLPTTTTVSVTVATSRRKSRSTSPPAASSTPSAIPISKPWVSAVTV